MNLLFILSPLIFRNLDRESFVDTKNENKTGSWLVVAADEIAQ